jgi:acyl-lipid omega-6 desaturase (Delta-12 desaturase)
MSIAQGNDEMMPSVKQVRAALPSDARQRSTAQGLAYFAMSAALYVVTFVMITMPTSPILRAAVALLNGLAIGVLFIVGHDACHGSLTPAPTLNRWLGRLAFLPSLHPYAAWEYSHNALHHGWTNLKGRDPVYCPLTLAEYRRLSRPQRSIQRLYRSWLGLMPLYLVEIWWRLEMRPRQHHREHIEKRGTFAFDRTLVCLFPLVQVATVALLQWSAGVEGRALVAAVMLALVIPFLTFNWLIAFATFQHHTHPRVVWYDDEREWGFFRSQVQGTVHITFPRWIERLLHNIMEHTAHHVDTKIPLYRLTNAQRALEAAYGHENIISERFSLQGLGRTFRTCQLYDFPSHQWLSFAGVPTTAARNLAAEAGNPSTSDGFDVRPRDAARSAPPNAAYSTGATD